MKCTNCGNEVPDTAKVCGYCGHRLKADTPIQPGFPPVQIAAQPVYQAPPQSVSAPPRKRGIPGWVWGLIIAGIILAAITIAGFFLATKYLPSLISPLPVASPSPVVIVVTSTATVEPTATRVPTAQGNIGPSPTPTVQENIGASPSPTQEPLPGNDGQVPAVAASYLQDARVILYDHFTGSQSDWSLSAGLNYPSSGPLVLAGSAGTPLEVVRNQPMQGVQAVLITFFYVYGPAFQCYISTGVPQTESYARFGVQLDTTLFTDIWKGTGTLYSGSMDQSVTLTESNYYQLLIAMLDKGDGYPSFRVMVFPLDDPQHFDVWNLGETSEPNFVNKTWKFVCSVNSDTELDIVDYRLIGFSDFK